ncbi:MAG: PQQ-like beta-propeller repeat protein, partial [Lentisphaeraceae bacterium]|nr:PQQ-like beta-propeller repeat protein [Lentisphaeraceae bacterium]
MKLLMKTGTLISFFAFLLTGYASDWENFRGPNYDGKYKEDGLLLDFGQNKPSRVWRVKIKTGFSSIVTSKGKVYTMGHASGRDYVYCLDDKTGKELWAGKYKAELQPNLYEGGPNATPTVHDGLLYTLGKHGQFYCWDANSGKEKWSVDISKKYG